MPGTLPFNPELLKLNLGRISPLYQDAENPDRLVVSDEEDKDTCSSSEDEQPLPPSVDIPDIDLPPEYWQIQKLVKYVKVGTPSATLLALCALKTCDLHSTMGQAALSKAEAIEVFLNVLEAGDVKCQVASLRLLEALALEEKFRRLVVALDGVPTLVTLLAGPNKTARSLAASTLGVVIRGRRARNAARRAQAVPFLVDLLDVDLSLLTADMNTLKPDSKARLQAAASGARALWALAGSRAARATLRDAGGVPLLCRLLRSKQEELLIPVAGIFHECSVEKSFRLAVDLKPLFMQMLRHMRSGSSELQTLCASAISQLAEDEKSCQLMFQLKGVEVLVTLIKQSNIQSNPPLLKAVASAMWRLTVLPDGVARLRTLGIVALILPLLYDQSEEVMIPLVGTLAPVATDPESIAVLHTQNAIPRLVWLLSGKNPNLLAQAASTIANMAEDTVALSLLETLDATRVLWSLLKNPSPVVQCAAASAIASLSEKARASGEGARSLVGGLELLVSLLRSPDKTVVTAAAAAVGRMASEDETLAILTDHHVVAILASLVKTKDLVLRLHLAEAVAQCCRWPGNPTEFGRAGGVPALLTYLKSSKLNLQRAAAKALYRVSSDADNCMVLHQQKAVKVLLNMVGSEDNELRQAAAGCLANIRKLALKEPRLQQRK